MSVFNYKLFHFAQDILSSKCLSLREVFALCNTEHHVTHNAPRYPQCTDAFLSGTEWKVLETL